MADLETKIQRRKSTLNDLQAGRLFCWWRFKNPEIQVEGFARNDAETRKSFVSGLVFDRKDGTDSSRKIIVFDGLENKPVSRGDIARVISKLRSLENENDVLDIVGEYGPLRIDARGYESPSREDEPKSWVWRCDTPQEWFNLSRVVREFLSLLNNTGDRERLIEILSDQVNEANVRTHYVPLPTGDIAAATGVPFDLHGAIWKVLESTAVKSKAAEHLRLNICHYCGEWDFERDGYGSRRMRQTKEKTFWYHDGCKRDEDKRIKDEARALREGRGRKKRPGSRKGSHLWSGN